MTPSCESPAVVQAITRAIGTAARALGLRHGAIHAECRVNEEGVFVLEVAPRPIGGLCARVLRFVVGADPEASLEEVLLRQALGEDVEARGARGAGRRRDDDSHPAPGRVSAG